jgi:hypothetical protein
LARHTQHTDKVIEGLKVIKEPLYEKCMREIDGENHICSRADEGYCKSYAFPKAKWRLGDCPMADEVLREKHIAQESVKVRVGQQKQKKKSRKK